MTLPIAISCIVAAMIVGGLAGFVLGGGFALIDAIGHGGPHGN